MNNIVDIIPLWLLFFLIVLLTYIALVAGFRFGRRVADSTDSATSTPPIGSVVAAMLGLLAFLLALTFSSAANRYETRKALLLDDVDAIRTVYLRSDLLVSEDRIELRELLKEYVDLRLLGSEQPDKIQQVISRSEALQMRMWKVVMEYPKEGISADISRSLVDAVGKLISVHTRRVVHGTQYHIHPSIWFSLLGVGVLSLGALGFQFGVSGGRRYQMSLLLAICFSMILLLILDLDRPEEGTVKVGQLPMQLLRSSMD